MNSDTDTFQKKLLELQEIFTSKLPGKIAAIEAAAGSSFEDLLALAHKLAGSAGTYGFPNVSEAARQLELSCQSIADQGRQPSGDEPTTLNSLVKALRETVEAETGGAIGYQNRVPAGSSRASQEAADEDGKELILVDDDVEHSAVLTELLTNFGYHVRALTDPSALEEAVKEQPPSAVIMDIIFPDDRDAGLTVINTLRDDGLLPYPVIFVSARDDFTARLDAIRCGADGYVVKPIDIIEMAETIERLIEPARISPLRVLIVDDDPEITDFCATILESNGLVTACVNDPLLAVDALIEFSPDILILDVEMPNCNGFELAAAIRQMGDRFEQISIVFLTAHTEMSNRMKAAQTGSVDFVAKPVDTELLVTSAIARGERARAQEALFRRLRSAEEKFSSMAGSANEAIVSVNDRGLVVFWNACAKEMFGYDSDEILGKPITTLIPARYQDRHLSGFQRVRDGGEPNLMGKTIELDGIRKDQVEFPLEISISSWRADGKTYFAAIMRDITERRQAEEALLRAQATLEQRVQERTAELQASETRLENILELAPEAVITTDSDLNVQLFNQGAERTFGYHASEIIGRQLDILIPETNRDEHRRHVDSFRTSDESRLRMDDRREVFGLRKDGTKFPAVASVSKLQLAGETLFMAVIQDITDRKASEAQLIQADKLATLGTLAAGTAHELSQPLNIIRLVVDSHLYGRDDTAATIEVDVEDLESVVGQVKRMAEIIDHMRIFSRKKETSGELFPPLQVIEAALNLIDKQFTSGDVVIERRLAETQGLVMGSPGQFEQVILNLLANARDALEVRAKDAALSRDTFQGIIRVELVDANADDMFTISVGDNGGGIDAALLNKIFDPFFTTKDVGKGTGLGLHVSFSIIESMGGKLEATNQGGGACFVITLPRSAGD